MCHTLCLELERDESDTAPFSNDLISLEEGSKATPARSLSTCCVSGTVPSTGRQQQNQVIGLRAAILLYTV